MNKARRDEGDYARKVHEGTREYVQDLMAENERLRALVRMLREDLYREVDEHTRLQRQLAAAEAASREFSQRYVEVERQNCNLANLYVASYRLHTSLERSEVLDVIREILANLVGSEETAVFEMAADRKSLQLASSSGIEAARYERVPLGQGAIGRAALEGQTFIAATEGAAPLSEHDEHLTACIPLHLSGEVIGVIAVFRLLPQKTGLHDVDREIFALLATHAAKALYCATLHDARATGTTAAS